MRVCVVGGANIDIVSTPLTSGGRGDSIPGNIDLNPGGVGRNIAENLSRMQVPVQLITIVGKDEFGMRILEQAQAVGIDMSQSQVLEGQKTSCYNAMLDDKKNLHRAVSDMSITEQISPEFIESRRKCIAASDICILDTNLREDTIQSIVTGIHGPRFILDTVSGTKAEKAQKMHEFFFLIKTNQLELACLIPKQRDSELKKQQGILEEMRKKEKNTDFLAVLGRQILKQGLSALFISLGKKGLWYIEKGEESGTLLSLRKHLEVKNVTGAGDAMCAGIVYALYNKLSMAEAAKYGMAASLITVQSNKTVSDAMSAQKLEQVKEICKW